MLYNIHHVHRCTPCSSPREPWEDGQGSRSGATTSGWGTRTESVSLTTPVIYQRVFSRPRSPQFSLSPVQAGLPRGPKITSFPTG